MRIAPGTVLDLARHLERRVGPATSKLQHTPPFRYQARALLIASRARCRALRAIGSMR